MNTVETVRVELIKQLCEIEGELWSRNSTFISCAMLGIAIAGISAWRWLSGDPGWAFGVVGGVGLLAGGVTLWAYCRLLCVGLKRRIAAVERNWPSAPGERLDAGFGE